MDFISNFEGAIRIGTFGGLLCLFALLELVNPRKTRVAPRIQRWSTNLGLSLLNTFALRILLPVAAVELAILCSKQQLGILNWLNLPFWLELLIAVVMLDMLIYWQHVASHYFPLFWRLHKVHHADRDIDVTTGIRFHPLEIFFSMLYKLLCVVILGPAAVAVVIFEVVLNACAMFNHSNFALPKPLDQFLRLFIVTPDMHRVHHSVHSHETHSNFGFSLSVWDRLFRTYIAQPLDGHDKMTIGLPEYQTQSPSSLWWVLSIPFSKNSAQYPQENNDD